MSKQWNEHISSRLSPARQQEAPPGQELTVTHFASSSGPWGREREMLLNSGLSIFGKPLDRNEVLRCAPWPPGGGRVLGLFPGKARLSPREPPLVKVKVHVPRGPETERAALGARQGGRAAGTGTGTAAEPSLCSRDCIPGGGRRNKRFTPIPPGGTGPPPPLAPPINSGSGSGWVTPRGLSAGTSSRTFPPTGCLSTFSSSPVPPL